MELFNKSTEELYALYAYCINELKAEGWESSIDRQYYVNIHQAIKLILDFRVKELNSNWEKYKND